MTSQQYSNSSGTRARVNAVKKGIFMLERTQFLTKYMYT